MWHKFWFVLSFFPPVFNVALPAPNGTKKQVNRETSQYITWFHMCKHKPRVSWWDVCPWSRCFTPHPLGGLFVSCFRAWQPWHRFLPSWPCSLKYNKSWIPRLCCTSICILLVADKCSPTPWERGGKQAGSRNCCPVLLSGSKVQLYETNWTNIRVGLPWDMKYLHSALSRSNHLPAELKISLEQETEKMHLACESVV